MTTRVHLKNESLDVPFVGKTELVVDWTVNEIITFAQNSRNASFWKQTDMNYLVKVIEMVYANDLPAKDMIVHAYASRVFVIAQEKMVESVLSNEESVKPKYDEDVETNAARSIFALASLAPHAASRASAPFAPGVAGSNFDPLLL